MKIDSGQIILLLLVIALLAGLTIFKANAQANVTAKARAEVIEAITATETAQLNFGRFSPDIQGGKIILSPQGVRSVEGRPIRQSSKLQVTTKLLSQSIYHQLLPC